MPTWQGAEALQRIFTGATRQADDSQATKQAVLDADEYITGADGLELEEDDKRRSDNKVSELLRVSALTAVVYLSVGTSGCMPSDNKDLLPRPPSVPSCFVAALCFWFFFTKTHGFHLCIRNPH